MSEMGRLLDKLNVSCRACGHKHIPRRLNARYHDGERRRIYLWQCKECGHFWQDSAFNKRN